MLVRKQKTYMLLDADDDEDDAGANTVVDKNSSTKSASVTGKGDTHKKRFRKMIEREEDQDDEA